MKIDCPYYNKGVCKHKIEYGEQNCPMCCGVCINACSSGAFCYMNYKKGEKWCEEHLWEYGLKGSDIGE